MHDLITWIAASALALLLAASHLIDGPANQPVPPSSTRAAAVAP